MWFDGTRRWSDDIVVIIVIGVIFLFFYKMLRRHCVDRLIVLFIYSSSSLQMWSVSKARSSRNECIERTIASEYYEWNDDASRWGKLLWSGRKWWAHHRYYLIFIWWLLLNDNSCLSTLLYRVQRWKVRLARHRNRHRSSIKLLLLSTLKLSKHCLLAAEHESTTSKHAPSTLPFQYPL